MILLEEEKAESSVGKIMMQLSVAVSSNCRQRCKCPRIPSWHHILALSFPVDGDIWGDGRFDHFCSSFTLLWVFCLFRFQS